MIILSITMKIKLVVIALVIVAIAGATSAQSVLAKHSSSNPGQVTIGNYTYTKAFWDDYKAGYAKGITDYDR